MPTKFFTRKRFWIVVITLTLLAYFTQTALADDDSPQNDWIILLVAGFAVIGLFVLVGTLVIYLTAELDSNTFPTNHNESIMRKLINSIAIALGLRENAPTLTDDQKQWLDAMGYYRGKLGEEHTQAFPKKQLDEWLATVSDEETRAQIIEMYERINKRLPINVDQSADRSPRQR